MNLMTTTPYYADDRVTVHHGDCLDVLRGLPDSSIDAIVTDPPYGLGFMGREWDALPPGLPWAQECLRVLKPGGHLLAFGGTRTWHRLAVAVEDAGFEIRDSIAWLYGSGFPKSLDVSKAIDKMRTEDRAPVDAVRAWLNDQRLAAGFSHDAVNKHFGHASNGGGSSSGWMTNPTSRSLPTWEQWAELKALFGFDESRDAEVWRLNGRKGKPGDNWDAREVIGKGTAGLGGGSNGAAHEGGFGKDYNLTAPATDEAQRWQGWGTALKPAFEPVVVGRKPLVGTVAGNVLTHGTGALNIDATRIPTDEDRSRPPRTPNAILGGGKGTNLTVSESNPAGRWPANVALDDTQAAELDAQSGVSRSVRGKPRGGVNGQGWGMTATGAEYDDAGGASRFFPTFRYQAKAPTRERPRGEDGTAHPTVKPLELMRWLVRLVTPPGGVVLEPFAGSGTTVEACLLEGFRCVAIEREADYLPLIDARIKRATPAGGELVAAPTQGTLL